MKKRMRKESCGKKKTVRCLAHWNRVHAGPIPKRDPENIKSKKKK